MQEQQKLTDGCKISRHKNILAKEKAGVTNIRAQQNHLGLNTTRDSHHEAGRARISLIMATQATELNQVWQTGAKCAWTNNTIVLSLLMISSMSDYYMTCFNINSYKSSLNGMATDTPPTEICVRPYY